MALALLAYLTSPWTLALALAPSALADSKAPPLSQGITHQVLPSQTTREGFVHRCDHCQGWSREHRQSTVTSNKSTTTWVQLHASGLLKDCNSSQQFTVTKVESEIYQVLIICNFTHIFIYNMHILKLPLGHEMK